MLTLALAYEPLSVRMISHLAVGAPPTVELLAIMRDITPLLLTVRDREGTKYILQYQGGVFYLKSLLLYSYEDDSLNEEHFRIVTLTGNNLEMTSNPLLINFLVCNGEIDVRGYTYEKFNRLNKFLSGFDKVENAIALP